MSKYPLNSVTPFFVGVGFKKQSGKGTFCHYASEALREKGVVTYVRHFATPLKTLAAGAFGAPYGALYGEGAERDAAVPYWVRSATGARTWREMLQIVGCQARELWEGVWLEHAFRDVPVPADVTLIPRPVVLLEDLRFPAELERVHKMGGVSVCITRDAAPADNHRSENLLKPSDFDSEYHNSGTVEDLARMASEWAEAIWRTGLLSS
jgi:hypothetical protein